MIDGRGISCEIALIWISLDLDDEKSTLVQIMAVPSHYLSQCWPRSLSPYGVTRLQWVKIDLARQGFNEFREGTADSYAIWSTSYPFFSRAWSEAELQSQLERDAYNVLLSDGKLLLLNRMKLTKSLWRDMKKLSSENMDTALTLSRSTAIQLPNLVTCSYLI